MKMTLAIFAVCLLSLPAYSHEYVTYDELATAYGWDFENAKIASETVAPGMHVLFGLGGNIITSIGDQGVLMVDSQFPEMIPHISNKVAELGGGTIDFTINTHWHFDHADGNKSLGRDGSWIVSQINSRRMMVGEHDVDTVSMIYKQPAYAKEALPIITFDDRMQFHFNNETIDLFHFGPAHTTGDAAVIFRDSNVVHMGDVYNAAGYPFIDTGNGGDLNGMILFCRKILEQIDEETIIVPGHGRVQGYSNMADYVSMLETARGRINEMIGDGMSLEQVIAAKPTADFDVQYGDPAGFINRAYMSLSH